MGLDSVELLMTFEKKFKLDIPDAVAEEIATVGDMTEWLFSMIQLNKPNKYIQEKILDSIKEALAKSNLVELIEFSTKLNNIFPFDNRKETWNLFEQNLSITLPKLSKKELISNNKSTKPSFFDSDINRLTECIGALNYNKLVDFDNITSKFEVMLAVMGITLELSGVDVTEIYYDSRFVYDLGID